MLATFISLIAKADQGTGGGGTSGGVSWSSCMIDGVATLQCLPVVFGQVVNWLLILSGTVALVFVILSGISFITSGGDQKKIDQAKKTLTYAIIGLLVIFLSFLIIKIIAYMTGAECINYFGFNNCS